MAVMKTPVVLESWMYKDPQGIADTLIARTERLEKAEARKAEPPVRERKDRFYTQSRAIEIQAYVKKAKRGGHRA